MNRVYLATIAAILLISNSHAADIARDVRAGSGGFDNSDGGYFEFGISLSMLANKDRIDLRTSPVLSGAYRYRGLFIEATDPGVALNDGFFSGITLGFTIWHNDQWAVDLLGTNSRSRLSGRTPRRDDENSEDPVLDKALLDRNHYYNGAGVRLTGYLGNTIFQYRLVNDIFGGNGITSSARLGYSHQVRNWNLHGVIGADYVSQKTGQYWYGVSEQEATTRFARYDMDSSTITYSANTGATYPVRENVVFRSTIGYTSFATAIARSPLQEGEFQLGWNATLNYVF